MYIEKGKKLEKKEIEKGIVNYLNSHSSWSKKKIAEYIKDGSVGNWANTLNELNTSLLENRDVFAICCKEPRNLDSGRHYYSIFYVTENNTVSRLWLGEFTLILGGYRSIKDTSLPYYIWGSGVIGMSRLLAATDEIFGFLRRLGGCYTQIDLKY